MPELKWLERYDGQTVDELLALAADHRIDSIVLAFEEALQQKAEPNEAERTILAVEALEREVNNGGYHQFFLNTPQYAPFILDALKRIDCPKTAAISAQAIEALGLRAPFTTEHVEAALARDPQGKLIELLSDRCDGPYYDSGEPIADRLFAHIRANRASIRFP